MTAEASPTHGGSLPVARRLYGFGSLFGKTLRDSRRATLAVGGLMLLTLVGVSRAILGEFATPESRQQLADVVAAVPPVLQGLAGRPVNVETLGGYLSYKYGTFFPIIASLWSILALSGTLAGEARRGSLEFVAAAPVSRRRIAVQKLVGHIVPMTIASLAVFLGVVVAGRTEPQLPGDAISATAAAGYAAWLALLSLAAGGVAWAVAPFLGRGAAVGIAGAVLFVGFIVNGYQAAVPQLAPLANLTWFGWTANHIPLAGLYDWPSLAFVAVVVVVLFVVGIEAFARRDLGVTSTVPTPTLPTPLMGLRGPTTRAAGEMLPSSFAWGLGLGVFGFLLAASGRSFIEQLNDAPDFIRLLQTAFPGADIATVGGFLQLLFVEFGFILAGFAAATLVGKWASDETSGRLEILLAAPLARARWLVGGAVGVALAIGVVIGLTALLIGAGTLAAGGDLVVPVTGTFVLGLYMLALLGIGFAVGGLFGTGFAATVVALVTVATWFIDIIAPPLGLPEVVGDLALTAHLGQPMLGIWDPAGIIACLVLAIGGVGIGAWGFARRDLRG
jgi:ABC-2 type transport system permease protein